MMSRMYHAHVNINKTKSMKLGIEGSLNNNVEYNPPWKLIAVTLTESSNESSKHKTKMEKVQGETEI
jgi:hypothetical protein